MELLHTMTGYARCSTGDAYGGGIRRGFWIDDFDGHALDAPEVIAAGSTAALGKPTFIFRGALTKYARTCNSRIAAVCKARSRNSLAARLREAFAGYLA